ncbi:MAG: DNA primase [Flavobacteriales bacterium]|nr:DNA primase [Flavobacteriales bacterium]
MIPKETVELITETARIDEVVGDYVSLKKRGANLMGLCPFHNEKTPSFTVSPAKGIYKCFGCGKAGNSVNFIMEQEHVSYPDALRHLARKYNITIEEEQRSVEEIQQESEKEALYVVSQYAQKHFTHNLMETEEGRSIGLSYFKERGFSLPTIEKFQLGFAIDSYEDLLVHAKENGYSIDLLEKCGLIKTRDDGKQFDFFRGRVIFPIHNVTGKVIAFGARTLKSDKKEPKYLNSPETEIYVKSNILYGISFAKRAIISNDNCFLVEGYTDVISLSQTGIENVVASSGTSLTTGQIRLIKRYTQNITILYDGDSAGIKASFRGIDMILEEGMNVRVLLFPDGEDPDSYARNHSTEEVHQFIREHSEDFILFKTKILQQEADQDPVKKAALIRDLIASIALVPDAITRSVYIKECSKLFEIAEQTLINELNKFRRTKSAKESGADLPYTEIPEKKQEVTREEESVNELLPQEKDLVRILLNYGERDLEYEITVTEEEIGPDGKQKIHKEILQTTVAEFIVHQLLSDGLEFEQSEFAAILGDYALALEGGLILKQNHFLQQAEEIGKTAVDLVVTPYSLSAKWRDKHMIFTKLEEEKLSYMVKNAVYSYKLKKVMQFIQNIQKKLKNDITEEEVNQLLEDQMALFEVKKKLSEELGRVIIR